MMPRTWPSRIVAGGLIFLIAVLVALAGTHQGRVAVKALLVLPHLFPAPPVRPLEWLTPSPVRKEVTIAYDSSRMLADVYRPTGAGPYGAVIIFLGVAPAGRDDPRLVRLAEGLARAGVVVMIPESENLKQSRIMPQEVNGLVASFQYLQRQDFVAKERIGFAGFCIGASLAVVAAQDPRINEDVAFVNSFGGYFNALDYIRAIMTKTATYGGRDEPWQPSDQPVRVLSEHLINTVENSEDREILSRALLGKEDVPRQELDKLSPEGRTIYELLTTKARARVDQLLGQLPAKTQENLRLISPSNGINRLLAKTYIMHDREDQLVPYVESRKLADSLASRAHYTEFAFFQHVDPTQSVDPIAFIREAAKLFWHVYLILLEIM